MVTGSHNPPDYNGLKMVVDGTTLSGDEIQELRERIEGGRLATGQADVPHADVARPICSASSATYKLSRPMKIAVDCGNGVAGAFAPTLFRRMGCEVDRALLRGRRTFPNHHPDPSQPKNLPT